MSTFKRMCAVVLSMAMMFGIVSTTAFASEPDAEIKAREEINAEYLAEMEAMGFTEDDVAELRNWNLRVANADSMREIDALMAEYQTLVAGTPLATSAVAKKIATYLGVTTSSVSWLVGGTIGVSVWILQNLDKWDLSDAIDNSTTGKVKLEFYYLQSSFEPYYQEFKNFEPWNSSYVEVPEDYDYTWSAGVYDY